MRTTSIYIRKHRPRTNRSTATDRCRRRPASAALARTRDRSMGKDEDEDLEQGTIFGWFSAGSRSTYSQEHPIFLARGLVRTGWSWGCWAPTTSWDDRQVSHVRTVSALQPLKYVCAWIRKTVINESYRSTGSLVTRADHDGNFSSGHGLMVACIGSMWVIAGVLLALACCAYRRLQVAASPPGRRRFHGRRVRPLDVPDPLLRCCWRSGCSTTAWMLCSLFVS